MSLWRELRRRDVFKVAAAYLVASWLIVQVIGVLTEPLGLPDVLDTVVVVLLAIGFPVALVIAWIYDMTPSGIKVTPDRDEAGAAERPAGLRLTYAVIGLLAVAAGFLAFERYLRAPATTGFGAGSRVAVLPCEDLSPDPSNAFFAVGIHDELLSRLGALGGIDVISRSSVQQYEGRRPPVPQIAAELDVGAVMECSVRYAGTQVMLRTQLFDASDRDLWSQRFQADMSNLESLFEIQAEIAMSVANALHVAFLDGERDRIERVPTHSREAYELYLAALNADDWREKLKLADLALAIDGEFVDAWILKATTHNILAGFESEAAAADAGRAASIAAANQAVALDPSSGRAYSTLAASLAQVGDWVAAKNAALRAAALGDVGGDPALLSLAVADFETARDDLEAGMALNPMDSLQAGLLLMAYAGLDDTEARRRQYERGELIYGNWFGDEVEPLFRLLENDLESVRARYPNFAAGTGNLESPERGLAAIQSLHADGRPRSAVELRFLAVWALYFGGPDVAFEWLREAVDLQATTITFAWLPGFSAIRRQPGFEDFLTEQGLPEYWDRFGWPERLCRRIGSDDFECD